jgi:hypothetical protein
MKRTNTNQRCSRTPSEVPPEWFARVTAELYRLLAGDGLSPRTANSAKTAGKPRLLEAQVIAAIATYRDAVRLCWMMRRRRSMTQRQLAEETGSYASHTTDYLSADESRRDLPAARINAFEIACGNRAITQWLAREAGVPVNVAPASRARRTS